MRLTPLAALASVVAAAVACTSAPPRAEVEERMPVRVHDDTVRAVVNADSVVFKVVATFTNITADTLHLHPCSQSAPFPPVVRLERREGDSWQPAWSQACTQALMLEPPRLLPGASRTDTVRIWASRRPNTFPDFPGPVAGTYRLVYGDVYRKWYSGSAPEGLPPGTNTLGVPAPDSVVTSGSFQVVE